MVGVGEIHTFDMHLRGRGRSILCFMEGGGRKGIKNSSSVDIYISVAPFIPKECRACYGIYKDHFIMAERQPPLRWNAAAD